MSDIERATDEIRMGEDLVETLQRAVTTALEASPVVRCVDAEGELLVRVDLLHPGVVHWAGRLLRVEIARAAHPAAPYVPQLSERGAESYTAKRDEVLTVLQAATSELLDACEALGACHPAGQARSKVQLAQSILRNYGVNLKLDRLAELEKSSSGTTRVPLPVVGAGGEHAPN